MKKRGRKIKSGKMNEQRFQLVSGLSGRHGGQDLELALQLVIHSATTLRRKLAADRSCRRRRRSAEERVVGATKKTKFSI